MKGRYYLNISNLLSASPKEVTMGLFSKKKKEVCPICGKELTLFKTLAVKDGFICEDCEKMIRGQFDINEYWVRKWGSSGFSVDSYKRKQFDPLQEMTIEDIRAMIEEKKADMAQVLSEIGSKYDNIAKVEAYESIAPKATDVGIKRAKELKNKIVATALVMKGQLARGDEVIVTTDGKDMTTRILDVIECSSSSTFMTELNANMGPHKAGANVNAWIFLDVTDGIAQGSLIQK